MPPDLDTRITLQKLEIFDLVVELGGVGRAAERLFVTQPVVSAHLRTIEERVHVKLFYREGRQIHLTEAGREVHAWAADVLRRTREFSRHLEGYSDGERGSAEVGASVSVGSYILPSLVARVCKERPLADIHVHIADTNQLAERTSHSYYDFAIVVGDASPDNTRLHSELLGEDELIVVAAPDWRPELETVTPEQLAELPFIDSPHGLHKRIYVDEQLRAIGLAERRVVAALEHPEAIKRVTRSGLGVAILFRSAVSEELELGTLRELPVDDVRLAGPLHLIYRKDKLFSEFQEALIGAVREHIAERTLLAA